MTLDSSSPPIGRSSSGVFGEKKKDNSLKGEFSDKPINPDIDHSTKNDLVPNNEKTNTFVKAVSRGLAGVAGGALYGIAMLGGGALAVASAPLLALVAAPAAMSGAIKGAFSNSSTAAKGAHESVKNSADMTLLVASAPSVILYHTIGRLGASLVAFAATGKTEDKQESGKRIQGTKEIVVHQSDTITVTTTTREKTTNEKLRDRLAFVSFPLLVHLEVFKKNAGSDKKKVTDTQFADGKNYKMKE